MRPCPWLQTVNITIRKVRTLKLRSCVACALECAEVFPPLSIRPRWNSPRMHHPQRVRAEPNSHRSFSPHAPTVAPLRRTNSLRSARPQRRHRRCREAVARFSLGARFRFLNVVHVRLAGGRLHREGPSKTPVGLSQCTYLRAALTSTAESNRKSLTRRHSAFNASIGNLYAALAPEGPK